MLTLRRASERGRTKLDWLDSFHTFSFNRYHDPRHMGFHALRVINDDYVKPGMGFGTHSHRDMEILTWVLEGGLEHKDSLGTGSVIRPGELQRMSAGTGVSHSEFNHSPEAPVHLLQIWILPREQGAQPEYEQRAFPADERRGRLRLIAAGDGRKGAAAGDGRESAVSVHQDADLFASLLAPGEKVSHALRPGRHAWLHLATGAATVNGRPLEAGDAVSTGDEPSLDIAATRDSEVLLFDLS